MTDLSPQNGTGKESGAPRIRRRNRMITSCLECRRRKLKCDKLHPCTNCSKFSRECMFLAPALDSVSQKKLNELKDKMGSLEKVLENDIARRGSTRASSPEDKRSPGDLPGEDSILEPLMITPDDEKPLECTPLAVTDAAYEDTGSEDFLDLGVWIGRMRLTERFGASFRPRFPEEIASTLGEPVNKDMSDNSVCRLSEREDFLAPSPDFITPGSGFIFGDTGPRRNLIDFLPSKSAADTLVQRYNQKVHFIARVLHWPSFQLQYESFWNNVLSGYEPQPSLQAVVFSVFFSAIASMDDDDVYSLFGSVKSSVLFNFQTATEVSLGKANFLRTTKIETLQALVIYLIPMVRDEISRAHSVLVSSALRLAECMGLHRDPEVFGMSPIGSHVRRTLWFQLCYLDFRTSESAAPRPHVKREDYDTRFPLDINDVDLMTPEHKENGGVWTDMTLSRLRFECVEMWRICSIADAERLRRKEISITEALSRVESFRRAMEAKYHPMIDTRVPIQAYAKHFLAAAMSRMRVAILHRFHHSVHVQIPDRLREILVMSAIEAMENFIIIQTAPEFSPWMWYTPGITTWNPAMLLLLEIFVYPNRGEADRIWAILDYTYQPDLHLSREQKARQILCTIRDRAAYYRDMRQIREPVNMPSRTALTVRMKNTQHSGVGLDSILLKKEEADTSLQDIAPALDGRESRKQSLNGNHSNDANQATASQQQQQDNNSWTFDNQSTLFVYGGPGLTRGTTPNSRPSSGSPEAPANAALPLQRSISQAMNGVPGTDYGTSPDSCSSSADAWPPQMNKDTQSWNMGNSPPRRHQPNVSMNHHMTHMPPAVDQMTNLYTQPGYSTRQLPFITSGQGGVDAILQPHTTGYLTDDSMSLDIDWGEWDKIFPADVNTNNLDQPRAVVR